MRLYWWCYICLLFGLIASAKNFNPSSMMKAHNKRRCLHGVRDILWDAGVERSAIQHSQKCVFEHSTSVYGENLWAGWWSPNAEDCLKGWYDGEIDLYDYDNPVFSAVTGHFTQVVWKSTHKLGCAICDGDGRSYPFIVTCQYNLPGNYPGQFTSNVPAVQRTASECTADCGRPENTGWDFNGCWKTFPGDCSPKCATGYFSTRELYAACLSTGQWWYEGTCYPFYCGDPGLQTGWNFTECASHHFDDLCTVKCQAGYTGNPQAVCGPLALWEYSGSCEPDGVLPLCVAPSWTGSATVIVRVGAFL